MQDRYEPPAHGARCPHCGDVAPVNATADGRYADRLMVFLHCAHGHGWSEVRTATRCWRFWDVLEGPPLQAAERQGAQ